MQTQDILAYLNRKVKPAKQLKDKLDRWKSVYYGMSLHTTGACPAYKDLATGGVVYPENYFGMEYQRIFDRQLFSRHAREDDTLRNWRYSQYRPLTKAPFAQVTELITGTIFMDSNYDIEIQDEVDNAYIWGNHFSGYDLVGYFANIGFKCIAEDPNAYFIRIPRRAYYEEQEGRIDVDVWFVHSKDIVFISETELVFRTENYGWYIDTQAIWRFVYDADKKEYALAQRDANGYYAHMLGRLPITKAGGHWNTQGHFESYYSKAKAAADDFIASYSAAQMVDKEASHPYIIETETDCPDCQGRGQFQVSCETCPGGIDLKTCAVCQGSGKVSRNPGMRIIAPPDQMDRDLVKIVNPDIGINRHNREVARGIMDMIIEALHLQKVQQAQSGVAKAIDQERLYKFISNISNDLFDKVITDTIKDIIAYRNVTTTEGVLRPAEYAFKVLKPTDFKIKTSADLLEEYKTGNEAKLPKYILAKSANDYVSKQFGNDMVMKKKSQFITQTDDLCTYSAEEIVRLQEAGNITKEEAVYSRRLPVMLDGLIREKGDEWFVVAGVEEIIGQLANLKI